MEQLGQCSIDTQTFIEAERDRAESICELVVFAEENAAELLESIYNVLKNKTIYHDAGLKWLSCHSQRQLNITPDLKQYRAATVAYSGHELQRQLKQLVEIIEKKPRVPFAHHSAGLYYGFGSPEGKLAYLFPGQGAQYLRMGEELAMIYPKAQAVWDQIGSMPYNGKTIKDVVFPPEPRHKEDEYAQTAELLKIERTLPAVSLMSESILVLLETMSIKPDAVAAHSLGDLMSYRAAGIIDAEQMSRIAMTRGVIASTCPMATSGGVLMVYANQNTSRKILKKHDIGNVWIVNYNSPALNAVAGTREDLEKAKTVFRKESINTKSIPINAAPHSPLASRGSNLFIEYLSDEPFNKADCEIYSYLFGKKMENNPDLFRRVLGINFLKPVRFVQQIEQMYADGVRTFVEIGPSEGLGVFVERILGEKSYRVVSTNKRRGDANFHFISSVAELYTLGRIHNTEVLWEEYKKPSRPELDMRTGGFDEKPIQKPHTLSKATVNRIKTLDMEDSKINNSICV
jgi:acyl transferase domain-containing protein